MMIGKKINNYTVVSNTNNSVVLAFNSKAVEPWVVWRVDGDGDCYSGFYCSNRDTAIREFIARSFR